MPDGNELSKKERHHLDWCWHKLVELCAEIGRPATAGEFAEHLGVARSTAHRWLADMEENDGLTRTIGQARNRYPKVMYLPVGLGDTWDYIYGESIRWKGDE